MSDIIPGIQSIRAQKRVLRQWSDQKVTVNGWISIGDAGFAELVAALAYDTVTVDLQHTMITSEMCLPLFQAISLQGKPAFARVPSNDTAAISKVLDAGALGVICPQINNARECTEFVKACRYPPGGNRSFGPFFCSARYGENYFSESNDSIACFAMIETIDGLRNIDEIVAVPGLNGIYIGPNDLSLGLGHGASQDSDVPEVIDAINFLREKTSCAGLVAGIACPDGSVARKRIEQGFKFVTPGNSFSLMVSAARSEINRAIANIPQEQ